LTDFDLPLTWDMAGLQDRRFEGFVTFAEIEWDEVPREPGIYVVLRPDLAESVIVATSAAAYVPYLADELKSRWIDHSEILYIGKANGTGGLRSRLRPFARQAASHSGGRSIWQLSTADQLLVAWILTPGWDPEQVEKDYIRAFRQAFGQRPFANRRD